MKTTHKKQIEKATFSIVHLICKFKLQVHKHSGKFILRNVWYNISNYKLSNNGLNNAFQ